MILAREKMDRLRNFFVDVVLVGGAVSYASNVASAWLVAHERPLAYIAGALHIVMLPLLLLARVAGGGARSKSLAGQALLYSLVAYYSLGFLVPLAVDEHAGVGEGFRAASIGGQVVVGIAMLVALLKLAPERFLRMPRIVKWIVSFVAGVYLLCLEAALMTISHGDHVYTSLLGLVGCAIVGYLPVRLYLAVALGGRKWDLVAMALAFVHFVWRIVS